MPELRKDPVIGRWIIIASERANRPHRITTQTPSSETQEDCPFCDGHESETPSELTAYRKEGTEADQPGWWVRVVDNKFPALDQTGDIKRVGVGMYDMVSGVGVHEVVIETPEHNGCFGDMPIRQVEEILWIYRDRILDLKKDPRLRYILIFKNHGAEAGASIDHPHSQIIGLPIVPKRVQEEIEGAEWYWQHKERCVFCDIIHQEQTERTRVVFENDSFICITPFASRFPYEMWILPKEHSLHYHEMQKTEVQDLARALKLTLSKIQALLGDTPFNVMIHTSPLGESESKRFHWHIEIIPRTTTIAGFEWGTGFYINPVPPEQAAADLKSINGSVEPLWLRSAGT